MERIEQCEVVDLPAVPSGGKTSEFVPHRVSETDGPRTLAVCAVPAALEPASGRRPIG
jgi:hypothetical protein